MSRVLVVDDEQQILRTLRINLAARGYEVDTAADGAEALHAASARRPDLVLLDLGLPDMDGTEVIRKLRTWSSAPIIVLSTRVGSADKVDALDAGADDYVTKPFGLDELLGRVRAVSCRPTGSDPVPLARIGRYVVDVDGHAVTTVDGSDTVPHLTRTEWKLLEILVANPGALVTQRQLLSRVWGPAYVAETHYLRQYLAHLRRKLEPEPARPRHLVTEPGIGYRFQP
jgi:two-component system KDP operon response regulator KdpE